MRTLSWIRRPNLHKTGYFRVPFEPTLLLLASSARVLRHVGSLAVPPVAN